MALLRKLIIVTLSFFLLSSCDFITNQDITISQSTEAGAIINSSTLITRNGYFTGFFRKIRELLAMRKFI